MPKPTILPVLALALSSAGLHGARMPEPISYTLRFPAPQTHYVEVEARIPTGGRAEVELMMAVWTPGSYLVREYARNVEGISAAAEGGGPLAIAKTAKNRWRIETGRSPRVVVRYRVYSREMSVRTNFVDSGFALINGAATFVTLAGEERRPLRDPDRAAAPVEGLGEPAPSPAGVGHIRRARLPRGRLRHPGRLPALCRQRADLPVRGRGQAPPPGQRGGEPVWDGPRSAADTEKIVRAQVAFWGAAPYPRYVFFNLLTESGGGLEHKDACTLMSSRWRARTHEGYLEWLGLVSHELFHAWNGKRLRPVELGPFDYEREVYTRSLWIVEGVTSYYGDLLLRRAGFSTVREYLKGLSKAIETVQTTPGRRVQSLDESSFDAWIKFYRRDENTGNSGVSYYTKGEVVAFLLDARIRRVTGGRRSLDDALRLAYQRFSGERGYHPEEFRKVLEEVAGSDLGSWLERAVDTVEELDYAEALGWYGLRFANQPEKPEKKDRAEPQELPAGWLGMDTEVQGGRLTVTGVKRETPAYEAGVNVGDELLAVDDDRIPPEGLETRLKYYRPGEKASLLVARRDRLTRLPVTFGAKPRARWTLEVLPNATDEQKAHLSAWLGGQDAAVKKEEKQTPAAVR